MYASFFILLICTFKNHTNGLEIDAAFIQPSLALHMSPCITICSVALSLCSATLSLCSAALYSADVSPSDHVIGVTCYIDFKVFDASKSHDLRLSEIHV